MGDWYKVDFTSIAKGIGGIAYTFGGPVRALMLAYPEYPWRISRFGDRSDERSPKWKIIAKQRQFFEQVASQTLNIKHWEDWYSKDDKEISKCVGFILNPQYDGSLYFALKTIYPEHYWRAWKFPIVPSGFWQIESNQREFFEDLARELKFQKYEDWYKLRHNDVRDHGGLSMIAEYYRNSHVRALLSIYSEYNWQPWLFEKVPSKFWDKEENVQLFLDWITQKLNIQNPEDWYSIQSAQFSALGGAPILDRYGSLLDLLKKFYPNHNWDNFSFKSTLTTKKNQLSMFKLVQELLGTLALDIYQDYPHPSLLHSETEAKIQFDIFIPSLSLAFEYQGKQHYGDTSIIIDFNQSQKDEEKRRACKELGITLIEIPYHWNISIESLAATIQKYRPELIKNKYGSFCDFFFLFTRTENSVPVMQASLASAKNWNSNSI